MLGVFAEALTLAARHSARLLAWSGPLLAVGLLATAVQDAPIANPTAWALAQAVPGCALLALSASYSTRVHRMILLPGEPLPAPFQDAVAGTTWRYLLGLTVVGLCSIPPVLAAGLLVRAASGLGLPPPFDAVLEVVLPFLAVQATLAKRQLLYLPGISLRGPDPWQAATAMGRGYAWRLAGVNLLFGLYSLMVTLFAGWLVGNLFPEGPLGQLEVLTLAVGLPAQLGCFACLQAACYRRLSLPG